MGGDADAMGDRAITGDSSHSEPQCYNCGVAGHQTIACPEPTRAVPAGLEAHRKRQASSRDNIVNSYNSFSNPNTGGTRYANGTTDSSSRGGRHASGHYAGSAVGTAPSSQSRHANGMVVTRYPPPVSPGGPQITHYARPPSFPATSNPLAQAVSPPPPPHPPPPPPPAEQPPPPPSSHAPPTLAPGTGGPVQPYRNPQTSSYHHLPPPPPPSGSEPWHYPASAPPSFQLSTPPVPYYTSQHYGPPQPDYFPEPPPGILGLRGGMPPTHHSSLPPPPSRWSHSGSNDRPHLQPVGSYPQPGLAAPASAPPAAPIYSQGSGYTSSYSDRWRQDTNPGGNSFHSQPNGQQQSQQFGQQNGRRYQRGGSFSRGRGGRFLTGSFVPQENAPATAALNASSPPLSKPTNLPGSGIAASSLPPRPPGIPAKPPTPISQTPGGGVFEHHYKRGSAGGYPDREDCIRDNVKRTRPLSASASGPDLGSDHAAGYMASVPQTMPPSSAGTPKLGTANGLHAPHSSSSQKAPNLQSKLPGGAPASLPTNPMWANRRLSQPTDTASTSLSSVTAANSTNNSSTTVAAPSHKEDTQEDHPSSKGPESSLPSSSLPGGAPSSLPARPPPPSSRPLNDHRDHHRDNKRDRRSRTRSSSRSRSRKLVPAVETKTMTKVNGKAAANRSRSRGHSRSRSRSRTRSDSFQRDQRGRNRGRSRSKSRTLSSGRSRSSSPLDDLELAMLGMAAPAPAAAKTRGKFRDGRRRRYSSSSSNDRGSSYGSDDGGGGGTSVGRKKRMRKDNSRIIPKLRPKESSVYSRRW